MGCNENERSVASAGSVEPVAYQAVDEYGRPYGYAQIILPFGKWPKSQRVALYRHPQPAITDEERRAIGWAAEMMEVGSLPNSLNRDDARTLRSLLERMK